MDPLTQGALGAAAAMTLAVADRQRRAFIVGALAGMAPDLDIAIRSSTDPLLFLEYHRHFTHALAFIPVGGLLIAGVFGGIDRLARRAPVPFRETLLFATVGWGTHGLLDACTSYGTYLYWPFSGARVAWESISIIDLFVSVPLALGVAVAVWQRSPMAARVGLGLALAWLGVGFVQHGRAQALQDRLLAERGHEPIEATVKPSFANLVAWRSIYLADGAYHVDGVRPGLFGPGLVYDGATVPEVRPEDLDPVLGSDSVARRDVDRFHHFSMGWIGWHPTDPSLLADVRYAMVPDGTVPLWGVRIDRARSTDLHLDYVQAQTTPTEEERRRFMDMLMGRGGRVLD